MDEILFDWLTYDFTFNQETETLCPECQDCYLSLDIVEHVYHCDNCGNTFVSAPEAHQPHQ